MPQAPRDLVFVVRSVPRKNDPFWEALAAAHLTAELAAPDRTEPLTRAGIAIWTLDWEKPPKGDLDREAAEYRARQSLAENAARLERRVNSERVRLVAFVGASLFAAALGERFAAAEGVDAQPLDDEDAGPRRGPDLAERTLSSPIPFGGAAAVAVPASPRFTTASLYLRRYLDLSALRARLTPGEAAE
jgi:hypothetical protein